MSYIIGRIKSVNCLEACISYLKKRFDKGYLFSYEYAPKEAKYLVEVKVTEDESEDVTELLGGMMEAVLAFDAGYKSGFEQAEDNHAQEDAGANI